MTDILVYTEEQGKVIAGSVQPDRMTVAVLGAVGGGTGGGGAVSSVNGQIGDVVLDAADVGADPAGTGASTAAAAVAAHVGAADPHTQYTTAAEAAAAAPVQSVNGETGAVVLSATDVGADAAGTAAAAVGAHVADTTPHDVITQVDKLGFDTAAGLTAGVGEMVWNAADGTADLGLPGGVTLHVGQEQLIRVLNKTGSTIQNMNVVYITGAQGNRVTAAQASSINTDNTLAVTTQDIANNAEGFATTLGMVRNVNTSAWSEGTELWLSAATPGAITNVRPAPPNHQVRVGHVVRSHATQGVIYVTVNIGSDLNNLHDVVITAPADNDILIYDAATQTWQNGPQTGGGGEVNTASNLGSGAGVFASKVGVDLQFKSLVAGTGVTLTPTGTTITITASGAGGAVDSVNGQTGAVVLDTDDVTEGVSNLYYTNARAAAAAPVQSVNGQTGAVDLSGSYAPLSHVGSGGTAHADVVAGGAAGFMTGADKTKLDGIAAGAQVNVPTNLTTATSATTLTVNSDTGTDATLPAATTSVAGVMTAADKTKLDGIASGATANATDAQLRDRSTHTGTQTASTISDFNSVARAQVEAELVAGTNVTITPSGSGATRQLTIAASSGASLAQVVTYAGTAKTLALTDINTIIDCTSGSAVTITIPPQSSVTWTADAEIHVRMSGTGQVSIAVGSGVTVPPLTAPVSLGGRGAVVTLKRRSADVWAVVGFIAGTFVAEGDARLTDAREWTAETVSQVESEAGTATTRRAWTAQRVRQAIVAWWNSASSAWGRDFVSSADAAAGRTVLSVREKLTANRTYYVRTDGSDSNDGLANTPGGAFLTIQRAVDVAASLDLGIFNCTIQVADGTYADAVVLKAFVGASQVRIIGNETTPASVVISGGGSLISGTDCGRYLVAGVTVASTGLRNIQISGRSQLQYRNIVSQGAAGLNTHLSAINYAEIQAVGPITLNGNSQIGFSASSFGFINIRGQSVTFSAGTTLPARGFQASDQGRVDMISMTFSGSFTGKRYEATGLGAIFTNNAGETYIPGTTAGTTATGGIYY